MALHDDDNLITHTVNITVNFCFISEKAHIET